MKRFRRMALLIGGALCWLILVLGLISVLLVRSQWFHDQVRQRIAREVEQATSGRVEIGSFQFDWSAFRVELKDFVVHGTEPPGSPPLLRVRSIILDLSVVSVLRTMVDLRSLQLDQPQIALIIHPDGSTNVPEPKGRVSEKAHASQKTPVETILDLAIAHFKVENGSIQVNAESTPWSASGQNLRAQLAYERHGRRYSGDLSFAPLRFEWAHQTPVEISAKASLALERDKITIASAQVETARSKGEFSGTVENLSSPRTSLRYNMQLSIEEFARALRLGPQAQGEVVASGDASFVDAKHYLVRGALHGSAVAFRQGDLQLRNIGADFAFRAEPDKIELSGIRVAALGGSFTGRAHVDKLDSFKLEGAASGFDVQRVTGLYTRQPAPWNALVSGPVVVAGRLDDLSRGRFDLRAQLGIAPAPKSAPVHGRIDVTYSGNRQIVDFAKSYVELPATRLDFSGTLGRELKVQMRSTHLEDLQPALTVLSHGRQQEMPIILEAGSASLDGSVTGNLNSPQVDGHLALTNFVYSREKFDSFTADINAQPSGVRVQNAHLTRGKLNAQFASSLALRNWEQDPTGRLSVAATLREADMKDVLAAIGRADLPVTGVLAGQVQVAGTLADPTAHADVNLTKGAVYGEPFDRLAAKVDYAGSRITVANAKWNAGARQVSFSATYTHAPQDLQNGRVEFQAASNRLPLDQILLVRQQTPTLAGSVQVEAKGSATIAKSAAGQIMFQLVSLNADVAGREIQIDKKPVGDVHVTAATKDGALTARLESKLAGTAIHGEGSWKLDGEYPGSAAFTFSKIDLKALSAWFLPPESALGAAGSMEGKLTISGPAFQPEAWTAALEIPQFELTPLGDASGGGTPAIALRNSEPVRVTLRRSRIRVESAHLVGTGTDFAVSGSVALKDANPLDLRVKGTVNLAILEDFERDLESSGQIVADATIRGPLSQPLVTGRMEMKNANLSLSTLPNGLSNANGVILFTGNRATIQNLTGESGGGKVSVTGFALYMGAESAFRLDLTASQIRIRYPEGASTVADGQLNWTGTTHRSLMSGKLTILRTGFNPHSDFASLLAQSSQPVQTLSAQSGLLGGVNFDIQVETSPDVSFQSPLAEQLQAEASLRLRGTPTNLVLLGRINITQGQLMFFGNKYTISQGSVSFFNPVKMEPILNIDLQTRARGIDVTLTISGPMNKLNVTYRSDPPLQFSDIVALLATGRAPSSDPSIAARESGAAQSWQQMGPSAIVGQAIANPVNGRLERLFGVSRIKIDPLLSGFDNNPQARLTLEQQITPDITFTYITNLTRSNPQVVRMDWSVNKQWSVVTLREANGLLRLDLYLI